MNFSFTGLMRLQGFMGELILHEPCSFILWTKWQWLMGELIFHQIDEGRKGSRVNSSYTNLSVLSPSDRGLWVNSSFTDLVRLTGVHIWINPTRTSLFCSLNRVVRVNEWTRPSPTRWDWQRFTNKPILH